MRDLRDRVSAILSDHFGESGALSDAVREISALVVEAENAERERCAAVADSGKIIEVAR